jgi:molybdate-binding protein/DNA-binding XRE family transcriptional regulator
VSKENLTLSNSVRKAREQRGWSQQELADRAGLSRTGISAIEAGRLIPSTAAALGLAAVFGCRVEDLFSLAGHEAAEWAWGPPGENCRYWRGLVGARQLIYPVEPSPLGTVPHDGVWREGSCHDLPFSDPVRTLVVACCDPAAGLLAAEYARQTPFRMLVLPRSSRAALKLLSEGLVHAAGVHLGEENSAEGNKSAASDLLGEDFHLLRVTDWEEGLALSPGLAAGGVNAILRARLQWIGREPGSGARQVLDEIGEGRISPLHLARDHRGVAQVVHSGFAQAGVSVRLVCEEEGLDFLNIRKKGYDLCILSSAMDDPRIRALVEVVRSATYRRILSDLPGYENRKTGELDPNRPG